MTQEKLPSAFSLIFGADTFLPISSAGSATHPWVGRIQRTCFIYHHHTSRESRPPCDSLLGSDAPPGYEPAYDSTPLMFGCAVLHETKEEYLRCIRQKGFAEWSNHPLYHQCLQAIEIALLDLLRARCTSELLRKSRE